MSKPLYALHRINGDILPGTIFVAANKEEESDLRRLGAVRDVNDAELALFEKQHGGRPAQKAPARGRKQAAADADNGDAGDADNGDAGDADNGDAGDAGKDLVG